MTKTNNHYINLILSNMTKEELDGYIYDLERDIKEAKICIEKANFHKKFKRYKRGTKKMINKLHDRICDHEDCENTETYFNFIRWAEKNVHCSHHPFLESLDNIQIDNYVEYLDILLEK